MTDESQWSDEELIAHAREMAAVYADVCSPQVSWLVDLIDRRDAEIDGMRDAVARWDAGTDPPHRACDERIAKLEAEVEELGRQLWGMATRAGERDAEIRRLRANVEGVNDDR